MENNEEFKPPVIRGRRKAVAAESYDPNEENGVEPVVFHEKSQEQLNCLQEAAKGIIFFKKCDEEQKSVLFGAMFQVKVKDGDVIIKQGDDGDNFYVIEKGEYDVVIDTPEKEQNVVATLKDNGFFGELALLYNCPRNATIIAKTEGVLWGLDQKTFRQIVVKATAKKRQLFEDLLKGVSMLDSLTNYELMNLTDALDVEIYGQDATIIKEGDEASKMYFVMEGEVTIKAFDKNDNVEKKIATIGRGKYFGEIALVLQKPRVASVYSNSNNLKLAVLDVNAFERLLGPCVDIMKRNVDEYQNERKKLGIIGIDN